MIDILHKYDWDREESECGLDKRYNIYFTDNWISVTCKNCLKILNKGRKVIKDE